MEKEKYFFVISIFSWCFLNTGSTSLDVYYDSDKQFYINNTKVSYYDALQICQQNNMQLASIQNKKKNQQLYKEMAGTSDAHWTSANRLFSDTWSWLNGEPIEYFNWRANEPNNARSDEKCIEVFRSSSEEIRWNDQPCTDKRPFICEKLTADVLNPTCDLTNEIVYGNDLPETGFYFGDELITYSKAIQTCRSMCMRLVTINTHKKNKNLFQAFVKQFSPLKAADAYWSSAHYKPENNWKWADNQETKQFNWNTKEPNNARGNEYCIEIVQKDDNILWNDQPCEDKRKYICETIDWGFEKSVGAL